MEFRLVARLEILLLEIQNLLHGAHQRVAPLLDRRDKPFGRIDLVLDELHRLAVLLLHAAVRRHHIAHHLHIAVADPHVGHVVRVERQLETAVVVVENKIGHHIGRSVRAAVGVAVGGLGREVADLGDGVAELILGHLQPRDQFLVVLLGEFVEIGGQDLSRQPPRTGGHGDLRELQQQAFAQVARTDAGRFEVVDNRQDRLQLSGRNLFAQREGDVVGHRLQIAAQIAVFVDTPHQIDRKSHLRLRKVAVAELFDQILLQRTPAREGNLPRLVVLRVVVDPHFIGRRIVLAQVFIDRNPLRFLLLVLLLGLFEHDVLLYLLLDALLKLHGGQFEQFNHLDLLRGELLLKRQHLFLMYSHGSIKLKIFCTRRREAAVRLPSLPVCSIFNCMAAAPKIQRAAEYGGKESRRGCCPCP